MITNTQNIHLPALQLIPHPLSAMTHTLIPLGSSNILLPPQTIYHLAFTLAQQQLHQERAHKNFHHHQHLSNN